MSWTETSSGSFTKDFDGVERIYRHISQAFKPFGREHWGLYCACTFQPSQSLLDRGLETALRDSWVALRHAFPGLAVVPDGTTKKKYAVPDVSRVEKWTNETFFVEWNTDPDGILASYPLNDLPNLLFFPKSTQILFLASHWRIDGIGTCMLLDRFFSLLANQTPAPGPESWGADFDKISPSMEDAVGAPAIADSDPELETFAREYIEDHHRNAVHAGGLSFRGDATTLPGRPARTAVVLSHAGTAALVGACKARGISVTSAVYAALAETVFELSPDAPERYAAVMSVNMRGRLVLPYGGKDHAVQTYVTGITPSVAREDPFEARCRQLTAFYRGWYSERFLRAMRLTYQYHSDALFKPKQRAEGAPPPKPPSNVLLSSLGVVENFFADEYAEDTRGASIVRVKNFRFGVSMMTRQMILYVWTFDGKTNLSVNYNDAYHDGEEAILFLDFLRNVMEKELGVVLPLDE